MINLNQHETKKNSKLSCLGFLSFSFSIFLILLFLCVLPTYLKARANISLPVTIQAIFIDGELQNQKKDSIKLKTTQSLTILFNNSDIDTFYYRLHNFDTINKKGSYPLAIYNNLPEGTYHFTLSLLPNKELPSSQGIVITSYSSFFEKWGFFPFLILYLTILLGGAGFIILITNLRNRNKFSELRTDWTNKLHNDIGGDLSGVSIRLNSLKRKLKNQPKLQEKLLKTSNTLNIAQKKLRTAFDLIDERKISIHIILNDLQYHTEEICEEKGIQLKFNNKLESDKIYKINERRSNVLYSLMKEGISNFIDHSQANLATVNIGERENGVEVLIEDNGIGFDTHQSYVNNGVYNLKNYGQKGAMDVNIESKIGQGTKISIFVPYL